MSDLKSFFLKEKPVLALLSIKNAEDGTYCSEISEEIDSTYAHTVKIISKMKEFDLLETREEGRKKVVTLSTKGKRQAKVFQAVLDLYDSESSAENQKIVDNDVFSKK